MSFKGALRTGAAPLIKIGKDIFSDASVVAVAYIPTDTAIVTNNLCDGVIAEVVFLLTFSIARLSRWLTLSIAKLKVSC